MFNTDHQQGLYPPMSPRISFSNGFVDAQQQIMKHDHQRSPREAPAVASSDFEFSVTNNSMMSADELFFRGRLLPSKDNCTNQLQKMTLREELLIDDDDDDEGVSPRSSKSSSIKWKEFLGLKRPYNLSKKADNKISEGSVMEIATEAKGSMLVHEEAHLSKADEH
ncbi:uncharacterized protein LOC122662893 [Telopea speciosissima]|uniref:uncharacterized protein LOC122662892 n=1 Tax=Telopea speciosissima TaxID=54955 RepID=UPI001CC67950|nr:uncharacterized protein LOC122662892 [Telopea speciosissima]XP_043714533.1 uncharacterized protein LOC122662893 [Telopea speciosissima]